MKQGKESEGVEALFLDERNYEDVLRHLSAPNLSADSRVALSMRVLLHEAAVEAEDKRRGHIAGGFTQLAARCSDLGEDVLKQGQVYVLERVDEQAFFKDVVSILRQRVEDVLNDERGIGGIDDAPYSLAELDGFAAELRLFRMFEMPGTNLKGVIDRVMSAADFVPKPVVGEARLILAS